MSHATSGSHVMHMIRMRQSFFLFSFFFIFISKFFLLVSSNCKSKRQLLLLRNANIRLDFQNCVTVITVTGLVNTIPNKSSIHV